MYAYLDKTGILHLHKDKETAERDAASKVVETDLGEQHGYPVIGSKAVTYYANTDTAYVDGNKKDGTQIATPTVLKQLVDRIR